MALIDTYRKNVVKKREEIAKQASDKANEMDKIAKKELRLTMQMPQLHEQKIQIQSRQKRKK